MRDTLIVTISPSLHGQARLRCSLVRLNAAYGSGFGYLREGGELGLVCGKSRPVVSNRLVGALTLQPILIAGNPSKGVSLPQLGREAVL